MYNIKKWGEAYSDITESRVKKMNLDTSHMAQGMKRRQYKARLGMWLRIVNINVNIEKLLSPFSLLLLLLPPGSPWAIRQ